MSISTASATGVTPIRGAERVTWHPAEAPRKEQRQVASFIGRYYAMDRDKRWERIREAYDLLVRQENTPDHGYTPGDAGHHMMPELQTNS
jgi:bisphosphoglycerate-independent phosphoglycerate mutase (AlkP superfamily)